MTFLKRNSPVFANRDGGKPRVSLIGIIGYRTEIRIKQSHVLYLTTTSYRLDWYIWDVSTWNLGQVTDYPDRLLVVFVGPYIECRDNIFK
jgi:hypothetical protein